MEQEESTCLTSGYTTKLQSSRQYVWSSSWLTAEDHPFCSQLRPISTLPQWFISIHLHESHKTHRGSPCLPASLKPQAPFFLYFFRYSSLMNVFFYHTSLNRINSLVVQCSILPFTTAAKLRKKEKRKKVV